MRRWWPSAAGLGLAALLTMASAGHASTSGHLYWSEPETSRGPSGSGIDTIWRASATGTGLDRDFVRGLQIPGAVATAGSYVYWSDAEAGAIGRARTDGTHVDRSLVKANADALAVTRTHLYWTTSSFAGTAAAIWRARPDGSHRHKLTSIGTGSYIGGLAVNGSYIYWTNRDTGRIGRANLNGSQVRLHFITGVHDPTGLALSSHHLYWASTVPASSDSIGRASLDGGHVNPHFIRGATYPYGVAVGGGHVYWANYDGGTIGRADLDGAHVQQGFIPAHAFYNTAAPQYLAVGR